MVVSVPVAKTIQVQTRYLLERLIPVGVSVPRDCGLWDLIESLAGPQASRRLSERPRAVRDSQLWRSRCSVRISSHSPLYLETRFVSSHFYPFSKRFCFPDLFFFNVVYISTSALPVLLFFVRANEILECTDAQPFHKTAAERGDKTARRTHIFFYYYIYILF